MQINDLCKPQSEQPSFLELEAIVAASLGDHAGVTAKPVGFLAKKHYVSISGPAATAYSGTSKKSFEVSSGWKASAIQRKHLLAAKSA